MTMTPQQKELQHKMFGPHYLMRFFSYKHLSPDLQVASKPFHDLAAKLDEELPANMEKNMTMRKLLEAKDCAVRAVLFNVVK